MSLYEATLRWITEVPSHLKTQEICNRAVRNNPWVLRFIPDHFKTDEMCNEAIEDEPETLDYVPDHFKTKKCVKMQCSGNHTP